jgi:hypothetical protein
MEVTPRNFPKGEWRGFPRENGGDATYVTEGNALGLKSFPEPRNASPTGSIRETFPGRNRNSQVENTVVDYDT